VVNIDDGVVNVAIAAYWLDLIHIVRGFRGGYRWDTGAVSPNEIVSPRPRVDRGTGASLGFGIRIYPSTLRAL
jgi:hypothetical protein